MRGSKFPADMHNTIWRPIYIPSFINSDQEFQGSCDDKVIYEYFLSSKGITPTKMRGSKFPADMHNYIWCPIYMQSFMIIGSVVSEELRWQGFGMNGRTDGRSDCTPRPAFAFGDAGKKSKPVTEQGAQHH